MSSPKPETPHVDKATYYARAVVAKKVLACKWVRLACQRHLDDLRRARDRAWPYKFDAAKAERVCRFISLLPHVKGEWARLDEHGRVRRIVLEPWQCFVVASLFGWVKKSDGMRRFRKASIYVPRKNAKSTLAAGIGWWMFAKDDEPGAEVYSGATTRRQAMEVFKPARQMALRLPTLATGLGVLVQTENMSIQTDGSKFEPVVGQPGDGASPHCAIVDEYHEHDTSQLYDTMLTGMGARRQPLILVISTAGANIEGPCRDDWKSCEKILARTVEDETHFALIYTMDDGDVWTSEDALRKANPNFDVSVSREFLLAQVATAKRQLSQQGTVKTKHLNVWVTAMSGYFDVAAFTRSKVPGLSIEAYAGRPCYVAADFAAKRDLCAVVRLFPESDGALTVFGRYYLPRATVDLPQNQHYRTWETAGWLQVCDGNANDFGRIGEDVMEDAKRFEIVELPFDQYQAHATVQAWQAAGIPCVEFPQGWRFFSEPMKQLDVLIANGKLRHPDDPVLAWALGNVVAREDTRGNVYPRKERDADKIDPVVALIMATARCIAKPVATRSVYSERGILVVGGDGPDGSSSQPASDLRKYCDYLRNAGRVLSIAKFDEDWSPIGPSVRQRLCAENLAYEQRGSILLVPEVVG